MKRKIGHKSSSLCIFSLNSLQPVDERTWWHHCQYGDGHVEGLPLYGVSELKNNQIVFNSKQAIIDSSYLLINDTSSVKLWTFFFHSNLTDFLIFKKTSFLTMYGFYHLFLQFVIMNFDFFFFICSFMVPFKTE